ncbi:hypothetical protein VV089_15760 [Candidatus Merdisoma sp. JLR.KK011]
MSFRSGHGLRRPVNRRSRGRLRGTAAMWNLGSGLEVLRLVEPGKRL